MTATKLGFLLVMMALYGALMLFVGLHALQPIGFVGILIPGTLGVLIGFTGVVHDKAP